MDLGLNRKCAIVTGGTKNIGEAITRSLLTEGAYVVTTYRSDHTAAERMQKKIPSELASRLIIKNLDVSCSANCDLLCQSAMDHFGRVDILVNNAALFLPQPIDAITDTSFDLILHNSLRSMLYMTRSAFNLMKTQKSGRIVNISTAGVYTANPNELLYLCAKAGIEAATRSFARLGGQSRVTINAIAPHVIESGMGLETLASDPTIVERIPLGRAGTIEEIAATVIFLCSNKLNISMDKSLGLTVGES